MSRDLKARVKRLEAARVAAGVTPAAVRDALRAHAATGALPDHPRLRQCIEALGRGLAAEMADLHAPWTPPAVTTPDTDPAPAPAEFGPFVDLVHVSTPSIRKRITLTEFEANRAEYAGDGEWRVAR